MINLLSPDTKQNIRAARTNVKLRLYATICVLTAIAIFIIYSGGFYLIMAEKAVADQQLSNDKSNNSAYQPILERAKTYKSNLIIAKKVLSTGMSYSSFITGTAQALPKSSVLTGLTLSNLGTTTPGSATPNTLALQARSKSYGAGLLLKDSLEKSDLFENVNISTITKSDPGEGATDIEINYPYIVLINVTITKQKTVI